VYLPKEHESQEVCPAYLAIVFGGHNLQRASGDDLKKPGSQFEQNELPKLLEDFPAGQYAQEVFPGKSA
jgi:hypothetical protein